VGLKKLRRPTYQLYMSRKFRLYSNDKTNEALSFVKKQIRQSPPGILACSALRPDITVQCPYWPQICVSLTDPFLSVGHIPIPTTHTYSIVLLAATTSLLFVSSTSRLQGAVQRISAVCCMYCGAR
jgi:hypothetical protein